VREQWTKDEMKEGVHRGSRRREKTERGQILISWRPGSRPKRRASSRHAPCGCCGVSGARRRRSGASGAASRLSLRSDASRLAGSRCAAARKSAAPQSILPATARAPGGRAGARGAGWAHATCEDLLLDCPHARRAHASLQSTPAVTRKRGLSGGARRHARVRPRALEAGAASLAPLEGRQVQLQSLWGATERLHLHCLLPAKISPTSLWLSIQGYNLQGVRQTDRRENGFRDGNKHQRRWQICRDQGFAPREKELS